MFYICSSGESLVETSLYIAARECRNPATLTTLLKRGANIDKNCTASLCRNACSTVINAHLRRLIFRNLALKKARLSHQQPVELNKDEITIRQNCPVMWEYYQNAIEKLDRMKATAKFIRSCSFFDLLTKCRCKIAVLMRHRQFQRLFRSFGRGGFPIFADDIMEAFKHARKYYESMMDQEELIYEAA
ncbi:hypothetical protein TSAR_003654 [Trichomalopsis sarcophagae]|uniref:Uncharacterized protein n=1 Tax=Trichomalopsis sarcophagae TaxID=543379 RepID=A0A232F9N0_9HYME|nr:hypothetical protein TSAR_003654 [Trichomalopsis sarcophagae]